MKLCLYIGKQAISIKGEEITFLNMMSKFLENSKMLFSHNKAIQDKIIFILENGLWNEEKLTE